MANSKIVFLLVVLSVVAIVSARPEPKEDQRVAAPVEGVVGVEAEKDLKGSESIGYGYYSGYPYAYSAGYPYYSGYSGYSGYYGHNYPYYRSYGGLYGGYWY